MTADGSAAEPAILIEGLHVVRVGRTVIPGLTLRIPYGQLVGLLGPSGCGKSTLLRCVVGVQDITVGSVQVLGLTAGCEPLRHRVGYLTQAPSIYQDLTIAENLRYFAKVLGIPRRGLDAEVARVLDLVDLADHAASGSSNLSGGETARVSLAAALLGTPEVLVLDEPTVGLDPVLRRDLWAIFRRLADDTLHGVLASTGATDAEQAFLTLVDRDAGSPDGAQHGRHERTERPEGLSS